LQRAGQALAHPWLGLRAVDDRRDGFALAQQLQLTDRQLTVVGAATIQTNGKQQRNPEPAVLVDKGGFQLRHQQIAYPHA